VTSLAIRIAAPGQAGIELAGMAAMERLLDGVMLDFAPVSLLAGANAVEAGRMLQTIWTRNGVDPGEARGAFNLDPVGTLARAGALPVAVEQAFAQTVRFAVSARAAWPNASTICVDVSPYHDGGAGEALELACMCA